MGTLLPADATRDKRSMLNAHVAALEGWYLPQSLDIWRQTPCKDCFGRQPGHAGGLHHRGTRSLDIPDSQFTYKKRPIRPKETTRRVRHTATSSHSVPRARRRRRLQDGCPWRRPLGATIGNIHDRVFVLSTVAHSIHWSSRRGPSALRSAPSPPGKQLRTLLYISITPIHPLLGRRSNQASGL
jgi:hypothetical protein